MKKRVPTRRAITLIEMVVVMILIATITGALALNYRETLNEGKAFKSREGKDRLETILTLYAAENPSAPLTTRDEQRTAVSASPLVKNVDEFMRDGWGDPYDIQNDNGTFTISSKKLNEYEAKKKQGSSKR